MKNILFIIMLLSGIESQCQVTYKPKTYIDASKDNYGNVYSFNGKIKYPSGNKDVVEFHIFTDTNNNLNFISISYPTHAPSGFAFVVLSNRNGEEKEFAMYNKSKSSSKSMMFIPNDEFKSMLSNGWYIKDIVSKPFEGSSVSLYCGIGTDNGLIY